MAKPPLSLSVDVTLADGSRVRWDPDADARHRPQGVQFRTRQGDGFSDANCTLARRIDQDYGDLNLLDDIAFVGADGATAYEGRVTGLPRSMAEMHSVDVNCAGHMAHARDLKFMEIYVDRDLGSWQAPHILRHSDLVTTNYTQPGPPEVMPDASNAQGFRLQCVDTWASPIKPIAEAWYDAGPDALVGAVWYDFINVGNAGAGDAGWDLLVRTTNDDRATAVVATSGDLWASMPTNGYLTDTVGSRYAFMSFFYATTPGGSDGYQFSVHARDTAVYGNHGLTRRGTNPGGVYASDVIKNIAQRFCPKLNTAGVQDTQFVIPHLVFREPTDPYDAFLDVNKYHLWDLGVWENKTLTFRPHDLSDYNWEVRLSDPGVTVQLQGDSADDLANGICVNYTDVATGQAARITPTDDTTLADTSASNPVNAHGLTRWTELTLSAPTTAAAATQIGRIALSEFNLPKAPGTITVTGHIKDRGGHWQQGWKVRAGDTVAITDHANDRPRLVTETTWNHDAKTLTISVEGPAHRLDALFDRITTSLTAANLT